MHYPSWGAKLTSFPAAIKGLSVIGGKSHVHWDTSLAKLLTYWLVFIGICGNTPGKEKNNMANSGVFSTDSLSNGHQGSSLSHTQDRGKNSEELEVVQTQSLLPRERLQLPPLPLKVVISLVHSLEFGGKRTGCRAQQSWLQGTSLLSLCHAS